MTKIYRSRAPVRITFGGGGTDIPPYDENFGGLCLGATIDKYVYSSLKVRDDSKIKINSWDLNLEEVINKIDEMKCSRGIGLVKATIKIINPKYGFELYVRSDVHNHSGLGASASACISTIGVLDHLKKQKNTRHEIAELAFQIEENIGNVGGRQDQYAAAFGGLNLYEFLGSKSVLVKPLELKKDYILELEKNLLIASTGKRIKSSGQVHKEEKELGLRTNQNKIQMLHDFKQIASDMADCLRKGKFNDFGYLIKQSWESKKNHNPTVTNSYIDALVDIALENGAIGARLMGAGGGGHLLVYCNSNKEQIVARELEEKGAKIIPFSFDFTGLQTWEVEE